MVVFVLALFVAKSGLKGFTGVSSQYIVDLLTMQALLSFVARLYSVLPGIITLKKTLAPNRNIRESKKIMPIVIWEG